MSSTQDVIDDFINNAEKLYDQNIKGEDGFSVDFQKLKHLSASLKISSDSQYKSSAGEKPENKKKNRYKDILPFDTTRVKLSTINNASDYINASFIKGTDGKNSYIASQGPLPHTVTDFWRMLWEYRISTIVMVCREIELGKQKCERYWPQEQELKQYDDILIILTREENSEHGFVIRHLVVQRGQEKRKISQIQYKAWPDHGVPRIRDEILNMIKYARDIQPYSMDSQVPLCIHCSAGCGRTGAVLAIDYFRNLLLHKKLLRSITVFNVVAEMRKQRPAVVQTKDQYEFVHLAVSEMFVKYIKDQGGVSNSSLSRALVSKNYENVTITPKPPPSSQKPTSAGNNDEPGRPFEQAKHRKSLNQKDNQVMSPMHRPEDFLGPPPPKPSRGDRPQRGSPLTRPVSSYETSNFRYGGGQLNKPNQDGGRKMSTPALKETQQPSAKPAVRKQLSNNSPPVKKTTALPMRPNTASNSTYPPNQISGAMSSNIKPKPRSQAPTGISLADYTKAADNKPALTSKPQPPLKPKRTIKRNNNPYKAQTTEDKGKQVNSDYSEISSQDSNSIANPAYNPSLLPEGNVPARMPTRSSVDMPPLPERTAASYQCIDPDDYSLASDPAARQYEDLNSNTKSTQDTKERRSSSAGGLSGYKAKAKNALGKTTNVLNEAIHQFSTGRQKSEDLSSPRARQQGYSQEPHMLNGQDISFGHRYQMRPTGPRPTPNHWK
uniref:tyrosine-protein phosphatase non-receptor type 18-like isoform X7 n=1 Tax=Ciona intestinalis TaxID=7719 RepID=UPI00089DAFE1|nr:tyrosine-protein phosphatase non-receptor type 18-like isoform X7 [Ciona intestinalis]|eukprot:XP_018668384.1 tyrosine-protein phosphatase non-receptor type 18-like isoform X7 [Ciona intestinalis]